MPRTSPAPNRSLKGSSFLELQRADILNELERYLDVLTDDHAIPIAQEIAGVLAFDRLNQLRDIDNEEQEQRA